MVVAAARKRLRFSLKVPAPRLHLALQFDELVQCQSSPGGFWVIAVFREVEHSDRLSLGRKTWDLPRLKNLRFNLVQRAPNQRAQPALRQAFGERINRSESAEMDEIFFAGLHHFCFRMVKGARFGAEQLAKDD